MHQISRESKWVPSQNDARNGMFGCADDGDVA